MKRNIKGIILVILLLVAAGIGTIAVPWVHADGMCGFVWRDCTTHQAPPSLIPPTVVAYPNAVKTQHATATNTVTVTDLGTSVPTAGAIPLAGTDSKLGIGWMPNLSSVYVPANAELRAGTTNVHFSTGTATATATAVNVTDSPVIYVDSSGGGGGGASGGGYQTVLDLDFSAQTSQSLATDTTYSIGGFTWTKLNSAHDHVAMAIVNGSGVVIQPDQACNYTGSTRTCPMLSIPLTSLASTISLRSGVRIWVYTSADSLLSDGYPFYENLDIGLDSGSMQWSWMLARGVNVGAGGADWVIVKTLNQNGLGQATGNDSSIEQHRVFILDIPSIGGYTAYGMYSSWDNGWPTLQTAIQFVTIVENISSSTGRVDNYCPAMSQILLFLTALTCNVSYYPSFTVTRVRVDVNLNAP